MVVLGLWQLDVYHSQGQSQSRARAAAAPVPLTQAAPAGAAVADGYGRTVTLSGRYEPALQRLVPIADAPGSYRVVTGLRQADGSLVVVVRGVVATATAPPPPSGPQQASGILLPSEEDPANRQLPTGQLSTVRLPTLAQEWPGPLVGGFVTLSAPDATANGLTPATVALPEGQGRLRNGAYALQWWVFAAFALGMALRIARDLGRQDLLVAEEAAEIAAGRIVDPT
ncbi:MAG: hypothetical protein JWP61_185 [Friedmanniella sp.]|nr:hypothetical protein [Friedmanniella sp.]